MPILPATDHDDSTKSVLGGRYCITRGSVPVSERSPEHPSAPRRFVTPSRRESVAGHRSAFGERISGGAGAIADHRWPFRNRDAWSVTTIRPDDGPSVDVLWPQHSSRSTGHTR